ncbi:FAD-dependent oxidoreductase [Bradyrhizobium sp. CCGUVB4N]|uniref:FAD-dependent oxidoreductase n=1 Tax=Bradyrhizobium sp. CCGUVB4N TaxID=2949631 RepID=UPI002810B3F5|nr:FAD-dependent oxidoreductase [Bradyrhizobium sp. CCGUVB4N]
MIGQADFVVVGIGAMGSSILYQLAKRGAHAIGVDRFAPPGARASARKRNSFC